MPDLLEDCSELFGTDDLYQVLEITETATANEVKRAYHKLSLKVHPDRVEKKEKKIATKKFQALGKVYSILSDTEKRKIYDECGEVDEDEGMSQDKDWYDYWRLLFAKVSVKDLEEFEKKYKGSDEELKDLKAAYMDYEGDMDLIMDNILCSTMEDEPRFTKILKSWIKSEEVPDFATFSKEKKAKKKERKEKATEEAAEAEKLKKELGVDKNSSLQALIQSRQQTRAQDMDSFFDHLAQKYAEPEPTKKKAKKTSKKPTKKV